MNNLFFSVFSHHISFSINKDSMIPAHDSPFFVNTRLKILVNGQENIKYKQFMYVN